MRSSVIVLFALFTYVIGASIEGKGFNLPCRKQDVGKVYSYILSPHKYLECTSKGLELKRCERGTWFSSEAKGCVRDEDDGGDCGPGSSQEDSGEVEPTAAPVSSESSEEATPEPVLSSEEPSSEQVESKESCESSEEATPEPVLSSEEPSSEPVESKESSEEPSSESVESGETGPVTGCESVVCPDDREDQHHAHPTRCDAFCQCSNHVPHFIPCPDGLHFNPELNVCDWPHSANCQIQPEQPGSDSQESGEPEQSASNSQESGEPEPEQSASNSQESGEPEPEQSASNSQESGEPEQSASNSQESGEPEQSASGSDSDSGEGQGGCEAVQCPADIEDQYRPHPTRCDAFCQCSNHVPYLHECPDGLHFNTELNVCDWPQDANCQIGQ